MRIDDFQRLDELCREVHSLWHKLEGLKIDLMKNSSFKKELLMKHGVWFDEISKSDESK